MPFANVQDKPFRTSILYYVSCIKKLAQKNIKYLPCRQAGKILNTKYLKSAGFTLIEFLVVLGILAVTVSSTVLFLNSVLKGSNQATTVAEVKQNGQVVLDSVERQIRGSLDARAPTSDHLVLTREAPNLPLHIQCFLPVPNTRNGQIGIAEGNNPATYTDLTNTDLINGVNITSCNFLVFPSGFSPDGQVVPAVVSIGFDVSQGLAAPTRADYVANVAMQTTISLRRY